MDYIKAPEAIEQKSFMIISQELGERNWTREQARIIMRIIHTTADFSFAETTDISPGAITAAINAIKRGTSIVTDTNMARAGINESVLRRFGNKVSCFMAREEAAEQAQKEGITRAMASMRLAARDNNNRIFVIGNAPTALFELIDLKNKRLVNPEVIIGVPVGFVGATEAKEAVREIGVPYIITRGRKGGSNVAAAIVNALLYLAAENEE